MWQYLIVTLIILSAAFYVGFNVWRKVAGKKAGKGGGGCETGCGKCGD